MFDPLFAFRNMRPVRRRELLTGLAAALALLTLPGGLTRARAQSQGEPALTVPIEELMQTDGLREFTIGQADAPVTIIEYASMGCGHCANFHNNTLPALTERYIDPGKARLIFREFPLDLGSAWASMLSHCEDDPARGMQVTDALFKGQAEWAFGQNEEAVKSGMMRALEPLGMTRDGLEACIGNQDLLRAIAERAVRAGQVFEVRSTPTFFINGLRLVGAAPIEEFAAVIDPLLES